MPAITGDAEPPSACARPTWRHAFLAAAGPSRRRPEDADTVRRSLRGRPSHRAARPRRSRPRGAPSAAGHVAAAAGDHAASRPRESGPNGPTGPEPDRDAPSGRGQPPAQPAVQPGPQPSPMRPRPGPAEQAAPRRPRRDQVRLVWVYPDLLSTYGDRGNLLVLTRRAQLRGLEVTAVEVNSDQPVPPTATSTCSAAARTCRRSWPRTGCARTAGCSARRRTGPSCSPCAPATS